MKALNNVSELKPPLLQSCGTLVEISQDGTVYVDFPENTSDPIAAQIAIDYKEDAFSPGAKLLLFFEGSNPTKPIICGIIKNQVTPNTETVEIARDKLNNIKVDGKNVSINAEQEVRICCGKSSIILRKDGRIIIKGKEILSRASGNQKIKGASVNIN